MTEELIREARAFAALGSDLNPVEANRLIFELCDALEAATVEPEWEYGHEGDTLVGVHANASRDHAIEDAEHLTRYWEPQGKEFRAVRRRKAGPWLPVGGESE